MGTSKRSILSPLWVPWSTLPGVGKKNQEKLHALNLHVLMDGLFHFPNRYEDKTRVVSLDQLKPSHKQLVFGTIQKIVNSPKQTLVHLRDPSGELPLVFFQRNAYPVKRLSIGQSVLCFGQVVPFQNHLQMVHPSVQPSEAPVPLATTLTPVYPTTSGLGQVKLQKWIATILQLYQHCMHTAQHEDFMLEGLSFFQALKGVHAPLPCENLDALVDRTHPFYQRLIIDELLAHSLVLKKQNAQTKQISGPCLQAFPRQEAKLLTGLGFELTPAQKTVLRQMHQDMDQPYPFLRLIQGDVGSGKTVMGALAALRVLCNRQKVALMVPTELLALQHYKSFKVWFAPFSFEVSLLTRQTVKNFDLKALQAKDRAHLVVGTHALFQRNIQFEQLALIIIDEQHRFGVEQRLALQAKSQKKGVHQLFMTATPIPRSLAMTVYAHLNLSEIDELPQGRQPITTVAVPHSRRGEVIERLHAVVEKGQQVYWVCPLIEESHSLACQGAKNAFASLKAACPSLRLALIHARMPPLEKQRVMEAFYKQEVDVLVATTVVEVGVNVPNATLMVIEDPERLGLSQCHQLRGRVGRSDLKSYCILLYQSPLSENARLRIQALRQSQDGFVLAKQDLKIRGPGELLGVKQSGRPLFKIADLCRDERYFEQVFDLVEKVEKEAPDTVECLKQRWLETCLSAYPI